MGEESGAALELPRLPFRGLATGRPAGAGEVEATMSPDTTRTRRTNVVGTAVQIEFGVRRARCGRNPVIVSGKASTA
jgi:hypothetical protein